MRYPKVMSNSGLLRACGQLGSSPRVPSRLGFVICPRKGSCVNTRPNGRPVQGTKKSLIFWSSLPFRVQPPAKNMARGPTLEDNPSLR